MVGATRDDLTSRPVRTVWCTGFGCEVKRGLMQTKMRYHLWILSSSKLIWSEYHNFSRYLLHIGMCSWNFNHQFYFTVEHTNKQRKFRNSTIFVLKNLVFYFGYMILTLGHSRMNTVVCKYCHYQSFTYVSFLNLTESFFHSRLIQKWTSLN